MTPAAVFDALHRRGLDLRGAGGHLEVRPAGRLTSADRDAIRTHLPTLLALAAWDQDARRDMEAADALVERLGVRGSDPRVRNAADAVARAYAARDAGAFRAVVDAFRECVAGLAGARDTRTGGA